MPMSRPETIDVDNSGVVKVAEMIPQTEFCGESILHKRSAAIVKKVGQARKRETEDSETSEKSGNVF